MDYATCQGLVYYACLFFFCVECCRPSIEQKQIVMTLYYLYYVVSHIVTNHILSHARCQLIVTYCYEAATYSDLGSDMIGQPLQLDLLVCILLVYIFKFTVILHYLHKLHLHLISPVITWQPFLETNIATAIQHSQTGHNSNPNFPPQLPITQWQT